MGILFFLYLSILNLQFTAEGSAAITATSIIRTTDLFWYVRYVSLLAPFSMLPSVITISNAYGTTEGVILFYFKNFIFDDF